MDWRRLDLDGVDELLGHGVYYGAGRSEAAQCAGQSVVVVGAGNSAGQAVLNFANATARVTMLVRGDRLEQDDVGLPDRADRRAPADRRPSRDAADRAASGRRQDRGRDLRRCGGQGRDARGGRRVPLHRRSPAHRLVFARARPHRFRRLHPDGPGSARTTATRPSAGRSTAIRSRSRRAASGSSPPATSATARRSASPPRSGKARWSPRSSSPAWPSSVSPSELAVALEHARRRTEALLEPLSDEQLTRAGLAAPVAARLGSRPHRSLRGALAPATRRRAGRDCRPSTTTSTTRSLMHAASAAGCRSCTPQAARAYASEVREAVLALLRSCRSTRRSIARAWVRRGDGRPARAPARRDDGADAGARGLARPAPHGPPEVEASGEVTVPGRPVHARLDRPVGIRQRAARARSSSSRPSGSTAPS